MNYNARLKKIEKKRSVKTLGEVIDEKTILEVEKAVTGKTPTESEIAEIMKTRLKAKANPALVDEIEKYTIKVDKK